MIDPPDARALRRLVAESAIQRVIGEYARGVDEGDWERVRSCFHSEATIVYGDGPSRRRDEAIEWLAKVMPLLFASSHYFGPAVVDLAEDGRTARSQTWCINVLQYPRGPRGEEKQHAMGLLYRDSFECRDGQWRILERRNASEWHLEIDGNTRLPGRPE